MAPDDTILSQAVDMTFHLESVTQLSGLQLQNQLHHTVLTWPLQVMLLTPLILATSLRLISPGHQDPTAWRPCGNCGSSLHASHTGLPSHRIEMPMLW